MNLDLNTFSKITTLLKMPMTTVQYNGSDNGVVCFLVGRTDQFKNWIYGVALYVTQDFKIKRVQRIRLIQSTGMKNRKPDVITIPIYKP